MSQSTLSRKPYRNSNLFTDHYLKERIDELDEWESAEGVEAVFEQLQSLYEKESGLAAGQNEDALIDAWIDPVLDVLGYGARPEATLPDGGGYVDRLLFESADARREAEMQGMEGDAEVLFKRASAVLEAKQWGSSFTERFSEERQYRDASHQVKFYLERTPESVQWGILTDGKKWRLYGTKDYETQTFYEVDLPELLETGNVEDFKYFYLFFRPQAFRSVAGTSFLDTVWTESETAAKELGEDLQDNVFTALRVLGKGFVETNDLDIDPDDEEALDELKEQSLVLLYRLMFILYAESRQLINPDDPDAKDEYRDNFSLDQKRLDILRTRDDGETFDEAYSEFSTSIWQRLRDLFGLIDEGNAALGVTAYNGGLFDADEHGFLTENSVSDRYIAEVIYRLSTTETDEGEFVLADYADLDTRHLGSIYEGLLEHEFRIAPEQYAAVAEDGGQVWKPATEVSVADAVETVPGGSLYVVNDEGERKATGAYYTPDYVVTYIVEETVDPLVAEIDEDLRDDGLEPSDREYFARFWQRVRGLKILDPAMGSGHFLTKATGYLTERVMAVVREQELQSYDEQEIRRKIAKECIYGVDLNDMAVELSKLSMWLETLAADQPLAFLDHHLKTGNSLVGSDISRILSTDDGDDDLSGQTTLSDWMEQTRQEALDHVMDLMADLLAIENDELADIKQMERTYDEIRDDPQFRHLLEMCSVHTAGQFGLDVPDDADEQMARALRDDSWDEVAESDWFTSAQAMAATEQFFHWELEFPEVFFDGSGELSSDAGFDAVVGNPPYVRQESISRFKKFFQTKFETYDSTADLYTYFFEQSTQVLRQQGMLGLIVTNRFVTADYGKGLRKFLSNNHQIDSVCDFGDLPVFDGATTYPAIFILKKGVKQSKTEFAKIPHLDFSDLQSIIDSNSALVPSDHFQGESWTFGSPEQTQIMNKMDSRGEKLSDIIDTGIRRGIMTGFNEALIIDEYEKEDIIRSDRGSEELIKEFISGQNIENHSINFDNEYLLWLHGGVKIENYPGIQSYLEQYRESLEERTERGEKWYHLRPCDYYSEFSKDKIIFPEVSKNTKFTLDTEGYFLNKTVFFFTQDDPYLVAVLNSNLLEMYLHNIASMMRGGYYMNSSTYVGDLPILSQDNIPREKLETLRESAVECQDKEKELRTLNLSLLDHLGNYSEGPTITEIGFSQPPTNSADSILNETTETRTKLQIERANVEREDSATVTIHLTARYKPDDEDSETRPAGGSRTGAGEARGSGHDLDQYGYTETEFLPALRITDLSETEADLVEAFVPVAVAEAGGFAGFRDNATKTNSLVDRLEKLTLPTVADVAGGLESYVETKERAEELDAKIERTDDLIDEIVYELYGLTDDEIAIVEDAVGE
ncbi:Eco57I restriction-modification methylase domain-containing protein [Halorussus litoreus]|uniref:Eco57I restriction-modification methylase domain-containing protein n=1 Tax=Halorussus litoreus TaxID=1710536 RepID=UPI000E24D931|nr:N-6 DNA methylase [Halorussus litoreus]